MEELNLPPDQEAAAQVLFNLLKSVKYPELLMFAATHNITYDKLLEMIRA